MHVYKVFSKVHTYRFIELYDKKTAIEKSVAASLTAYDNKMMLEKSLKEMSKPKLTQMKSKSLNINFTTVKKIALWNRG